VLCGRVGVLRYCGTATLGCRLPMWVDYLLTYLKVLSMALSFPSLHTPRFGWRLSGGFCLALCTFLPCLTTFSTFYFWQLVTGKNPEREADVLCLESGEGLPHQAKERHACSTP
jgi:hypothetical protein